VGDSVGQTLSISGRLPATGVLPKPQPAGALLSRLWSFLDGQHSCLSHDANILEHLPKWWCKEPSTSNRDWVVPSLPSSLPTLLDEVFILGLLALVRLGTPFFPRHRQLHNDNLLCLAITLLSKSWLHFFSKTNFVCYYVSSVIDIESYIISIKLKCVKSLISTQKANWKIVPSYRLQKFGTFPNISYEYRHY